MSTELDAYFAALRHDADELPAAAPDVARRLGRRRRRRSAVLAAVAVFVVVGTVAVATGAGLPHRRAQPAVPTPVPTGLPTGPAASVSPPAQTVFRRLAPVGAGIGLGQTQPLRFGTVVTAGDRAFVCWQSESGRTSVVAVDLRTGRAVWGPVHLADFGDAAAVYWHPRYMLVTGRHDNGTRPDGTVFALDPATGKVLLHVDVDNFEADEVVIGASTLVVASRPDRTTRGYDLATGRVLWTVPDPASQVVQSVPVQSAAGSPPESQRGGFGGPPLAVDRFVQLTADGTAIVRDLATGAETARRTGAAGTTDDLLAVDGVLYTVDANARRAVRAIELTGQAAATTVYTADSGVRLDGLFWCGPARVCVGEHRDPDVDRVAGLDTGARQVRWRQDGLLTRLQVVGDRVLLNLATARGDGRSAVVDAAGRQLLAEGAQAGTAGWVDGNALLLLRGAQDGPAAAVAGVSPLDGGPVSLGTVDDGHGCGWSRTHLVCVTAKGVKVWRFTA